MSSYNEENKENVEPRWKDINDKVNELSSLSELDTSVLKDFKSVLYLEDDTIWKK